MFQPKVVQLNDFIFWLYNSAKALASVGKMPRVMALDQEQLLRGEQTELGV